MATAPEDFFARRISRPSGLSTQPCRMSPRRAFTKKAGRSPPGFCALSGFYGDGASPAGSVAAASAAPYEIQGQQPDDHHHATDGAQASIGHRMQLLGGAF